MNLDSLFEAARQDGPSDDRKKSTWNQIASATGAAGVAVAAKSSVGAKALALKIFLLSAVVLTAGGGAALAVGDSVENHATAVPSHGGASGPAAGTHARMMDDAPNRALAIDFDEVPKDVGMPTDDGRTPVGTVAAVEEESGLEAETRLVTDARAAVVRGDAATAMQLLDKAKLLKVRTLEPEELALEVRAARALGRVDAAEAAELRLKARYPEHALAH